ncbi:LysM peptidoglycan-binding domain-containing protein [Marinobacterium sp. BA1]|uniref:LysM peptidoglycan-binding domain-containing protein n=1 Tax=Marinobacterium sp. BA1 TaxID=3138931 RepID=UPI0032E6327A
MSDEQYYQNGQGEDAHHDQYADHGTDNFGVQIDPSEQGDIYEHSDEQRAYEGHVAAAPPPKKKSKLKPILFIGSFGLVGLGAMAAMNGVFSGGAVQPQASTFQQPQMQAPIQQPTPTPVDHSADAEVDRIAALMEGRATPAPNGSRASTNVPQAPRNATTAAPAPGNSASEGSLSIEGDAGSIEGMIQQMVGQMDDVAVRVAEIEKHNRETQAQVRATQQEVGALKQAQSTTLQSLVQMQKQLDEILRGSSQTAQRASGNGTGNSGKQQSVVGGMHTVARGESLSLIAAKYGVSLEALVKTNGINNPSFIPVGLKVRVDGNDISDAEKARNARLTTGAIAATTRSGGSAVAKYSGPVWQVAGMSPGRVVLVSRDGQYVSGAVGESVPGVGRITSINMASQTVSTTGGTLRLR